MHLGISDPSKYQWSLSSLLQAVLCLLSAKSSAKLVMSYQSSVRHDGMDFIEVLKKKKKYHIEYDSHHGQPYLLWVS